MEITMTIIRKSANNINEVLGALENPSVEINYRGNIVTKENFKVSVNDTVVSSFWYSNPHLDPIDKLVKVLSSSTYTPPVIKK